jgi:hypothetical protein
VSGYEWADLAEGDRVTDGVSIYVVIGEHDEDQDILVQTIHGAKLYLFSKDSHRYDLVTGETP